MPNHVMNRITLDCSDERAKEIMEAVQYDPNPDDEEGTGFGTLDFNKLIPMPPSLMIEAGSSTEQGIEIYLTAVNPDTPDYDLSKMPKDKFDRLVSDLNAERRFTLYKSRLSDSRTEIPDIKRAAYFYQLIRESYASGLDSFASQPHSMWNNFPLIHEACRRLQKVVIENKDFEKLIKQYDRPESFFYCDPDRGIL